LDNFDSEFWNALDCLVETSEIVIDRPKGSAHPNYPSLVYPADYGYLKNTASMDGEGIDLWRGEGEPAVTAVLCTVDLLKRDCEIKILLGCTEKEREAILKTQSRTPYMKAILIRR
jgi:inorganic pyrophosphatase